MYLAVGRLAITSNPRARDNLVDTLLILCQLDAGETDIQDTDFEALITKALSAFQTVPVESEGQAKTLSKVLQAFWQAKLPVGCKRHEKFTELIDTMM